MHPVEALTRVGGIADRKTLLRVTSRARLRTALSHGQIIKAGSRGFALPTAPDALRAARTLNGIVSHESAASYHGWGIKLAPDRPSVIVPRHRNPTSRARQGVELRFRTLTPDDHDGIATGPLRTVIDCARDLPFDQALAVADSALRAGVLTTDDLIEAALRLSTNGRRQALRIAESADERAANPFESVLRAIASEVPGLALEPQVVIDEHGLVVRPDLVDRTRRIVVEADSFEFHSTRSALRRDIERYTNLVARGWTVLRFAWEHAMFYPDYVRACLVAVATGPRSLATLPGKPPVRL